MNCKACGKELTRRHQTKYCSRGCAQEHQRSERREASEEKRRRICGVCGKEFVMPHASSRALRGEDKAGLYCSRKCSGLGRRKERPEPDKKYCKICGKETPSRRDVYCSDDCRRKRNRDRYYEKHEQSLEAARIRDSVKVAPKHKVECRDCGKVFMQEYRNCRSVYCSEECSRRGTRRDSKQKRRARLAGVRVERIYKARIYKRDGGKCQICGKKVLMDKKCPHPLSPSIDHIIPLSRGGAHEMRNVRLAHFICNSIKGDRVSAGGDQLLLFG